jgi:transposase
MIPLPVNGLPASRERGLVLSGIIFINRNGLRWSDAPKEYGPAKTLYNRWKRWGDMGVFARMMEGLASEAAVPTVVMIDATYLKAHRTASSLGVRKGGRSSDWPNQGRHEHQRACCYRREWTTHPALHDRRTSQ